MDPVSEEIKKLELKINELKNLQNLQKDDHNKRLKTLFEYNFMVMEDLLDKNKKVYQAYEDEHIPWDISKNHLHNTIDCLESLKRRTVKMLKHM